MGIGAGSFLQASFGVSQALVGPEDIPDAVGLISVGKASLALSPLCFLVSMFHHCQLSSLADLLQANPSGLSFPWPLREQYIKIPGSGLSSLFFPLHPLLMSDQQSLVPIALF